MIGIEPASSLQGNLEASLALVISKPFDPFTFVDAMHQFIGSSEAHTSSIGFDEWIRRRDKFVKAYMEQEGWQENLSYGEIYSRINAVHSADFAIEETDSLSKEIHEGADISELIERKALVEIIALHDQHTDGLHHLQNTGRIDKKWVTTQAMDALSVGSGLIALCAKENISLGRSLVDLGGGDGTLGLIMAQLGFAVTLIERDKNLVEHTYKAIEQLKERGIQPGFIRQLLGEFHVEKEKNTPEINQALQTADIMYCYPWPEEVEDRLKLFSENAKQNSILVLYGSGVDDFSIKLNLLDKYNLEFIGISTDEIREGQKEGRIGRFRGLRAAGVGSNWMALRKKQA